MSIFASALAQKDARWITYYPKFPTTGIDVLKVRANASLTEKAEINLVGKSGARYGFEAGVWEVYKNSFKIGSGTAIANSNGWRTWTSEEAMAFESVNGEFGPEDVMLYVEGDPAILNQIEYKSCSFNKDVKKAAKEGDAYAKFKMGVSFITANGIEASSSEAMTFLTQAFYQGKFDVQAKVVSLYFYGIEGYMARNIDRSLSFAKKMKASGSDLGFKAIRVGSVGLVNTGDPEQAKLGVSTLEQLATAGDIESMSALAEIYGDQDKYPAYADYKKAYDNLQKVYVKNKDAACLYKQYKLVSKGHSTLPKDETRAKDLLKQAVNGGYKTATFELAQAEFAAKNYADAYKLYKSENLTSEEKEQAEKIIYDNFDDSGNYSPGFQEKKKTAAIKPVGKSRAARAAAAKAAAEAKAAEEKAAAEKKAQEEAAAAAEKKAQEEAAAKAAAEEKQKAKAEMIQIARNNPNVKYNNSTNTLSMVFELGKDDYINVTKCKADHNFYEQYKTALEMQFLPESMLQTIQKAGASFIITLKSLSQEVSFTWK